MLTSFQRRRFLLFLIAILLPSSLLVLLTWRLIGQQAELDEKRLAESRRRYALDIGQQLLARLEQIKLQEVSGAAQGRAIESREYTSRAVALIGLTDGKCLLLPWEANQNFGIGGHSLTHATFVKNIWIAERLELQDGQFDDASQLYLEHVEAAKAIPQQVYARLLRARSLGKAGLVDESLEEYRAVLAEQSDVADEHGVPLWLYAARRLVQSKDVRNEVVELIRDELNRQRWLPPGQEYMLRDLVHALVESKPESSVRRVAVECQETLSEHIALQEQALALQTDFPKLLFAAGAEPLAQSREPLWLPYAEGNLLISLTPPVSRNQRMVIVVRSQNLLDSIVSDMPTQEVRFGVSASRDDETLGTNFPGLTVSFQLADDALSLGHGQIRRSVYVAALVFVLFLTVLGAYLLWRDMNRELRMAEMRSQFVASVSHELKTPLTAIRMFAESLRLGRPEDPQAKQEYLETIINESHRLTRLLMNVLDFSKLEKGKRTYRKDLVSLSDVVKSAARVMRYPLEQQGLQLHMDVDNGIEKLYLDGDAIEQAVLNLLSNAMKYSRESIDIRLFKRDGNAVIDVSDHGEGIEPAAQKHIFDKFYRVPSPENERIPGTGLGLALVSHIIAAHDGHVTVDSLPGEGCTFSIVLPLESQP